MNSAVHRWTLFVVPCFLVCGVWCGGGLGSNVADNWLAGFPPTNFASNQLYQINIRSNYFTGGTAYKTTSGKPICPNKVNSYIISSSAVRPQAFLHSWRGSGGWEEGARPPPASFELHP